MLPGCQPAALQLPVLAYSARVLPEKGGVSGSQVCYHWGGGAGRVGGGVAGIKPAGGRPIPGYTYQQHPWRRTAL